MVGTCWRPCSVDDTRGKFDGLLWSKDSGNHLYGQFSMAVVQANYELEDRSQVESGHLSSTSSGPQGTFIGVYDGHGGAEAASFITQHLFSNLNWIVSEHEGVSEKAIKKAFAATEDDFLYFVKKQWLGKPNMASVGSCCLAGILCNGLLYIANAGDSRAVLGTVESGTREIRAIQLSKEHNATIESVRDELRSLHPNDPDIVVQKNDAWRVKGIIQVSRSIGDAYLKRTEFNKEPLPSKYRLPKPFQEPILGPEPEISVHRIRPEDKFLIFASDGLWECLSNQEAVNIVRNSPRHGIAKRLVKAAIKKAAKNKEIRYSDLLKIEQGVRRHFHDDITVVVVFVDSRSGNRGSPKNCSVSVKGGVCSTV